MELSVHGRLIRFDRVVIIKSNVPHFTLFVAHVSSAWMTDDSSLVGLGVLRYRQHSASAVLMVCHSFLDY